MYSKILVPLDGSKLAECSLGHLKSTISGNNNPEIVLLRVMETVSSNDIAAWAQAGYTLADIEKRNRSQVQEYLSNAVERLAKEGISANSEITYGRPAEAILDFAEKNKVDLIIISSHGRTGISRWALGSVADRVVHHSSIPVLVITPPECRTNRGA